MNKDKEKSLVKNNCESISTKNINSDKWFSYPRELTIAGNIKTNSKYNFQKEINTINDKNIKVFAKWCISILPSYFFEIPASSTGKYHPKYALGEGGLVRHTMATIRIANELFNNHTIQDFNDIEQDIIRVSLLIHDGVKRGIDGKSYTTSTHPLEVINLIEFIYKNNNTLADEIRYVMNNFWYMIKCCVTSHMGEWNKDYITHKEILPLPQTKIQKFVHLCDYLASRKLIEINFEV